MVENNIDMIEEILTDLQNNDFSRLTSFNICKARKGIQYMQKHLPEIKSISFIVDFFHEHIKKIEWMKETEIMNHVKNTQLEDAKKEIESCKTRMRELKQQGLEPRVGSSSSFRSSTECSTHLPSTLGLIKTIVEEEEFKERLYNMTSSSSMYINDGNDETLANLRKQIQERNQTFRVMEEKLQNCEQIFTHFCDGQALGNDGSDQERGEMKKLTEVEKLKESNPDLLSRRTLVNSGSDQGSGEMKKLTEEEKLKESNTDLLNRLSRTASEKLRNENPNITDLGDQNRPSKLAEQFSELYDNEWTYAFEELSNTVQSDEQRITTLLEIVMRAFQLCEKTTEEQFENLKRALRKEMLFASDSKNGEETDEGQNVVFDEVILSLRELRQRCAIVSIPKLKQMIAEHESEGTAPKAEQGIKLKLYTDRCVELAWMMCIQNPQMYLYRCEAGVPSEENFRSYTRSGTVVEYCVWPCVYLHKGGPIMMKGVAQMIDPTQREK
ncbi:hypothetical protein CHS0354_026401 [Potamilus streckersoni]|uniref:Mitochondria-eating protein n=1 Tax=Potamilus streckersoni TaxID=2493646 RepID=A0AAE0T2Y9_9BIVA|nr:hypothetical protein CHS0354_026401 [Potamilus streckersoni]